MTRPRNKWTAMAIVAGLCALPQAVLAASGDITVTIEGVAPGGSLPDAAAFCPPAGGAGDISPALSWSPGPEGTKSYAITLADPDVPEDLSLINKPGTVIAQAAPRIKIFHWVLVDVPAALTSLSAGADSAGLVPGGKPVGPTDHGLRGANVFTTFLASTQGKAGTYGGYDGPCPPANDELVHRYVFRVVALDVETLGLSGAFDGAAAEKAMAGHILAEGQTVTHYSLNPPATPDRGAL